jgi:hypothetical protein
MSENENNWKRTSNQGSRMKINVQIIVFNFEDNCALLK